MEENEVKTNNEDLTSLQTAINEYKKLQETTVSKDKYNEDIEKVKAERDLYLKAITDGSKIDTPEEDSRSLEDTAAEIAKFKGTNLDFWKKTTPYIKRVVEELPQEELTKLIGQDGLKELIEVQQGMSQLVADAGNDSDYFNSLYQKRVEESSPEIASKIARAGGLVNYLEQQQNK